MKRKRLAIEDATGNAPEVISAENWDYATNSLESNNKAESFEQLMERTYSTLDTLRLDLSPSPSTSAATLINKQHGMIGRATILPNQHINLGYATTMQYNPPFMGAGAIASTSYTSEDTKPIVENIESKHLLEKLKEIVYITDVVVLYAEECGELGIRVEMDTRHLATKDGFTFGVHPQVLVRDVLRRYRVTGYKKVSIIFSEKEEYEWND